MGVKSMKAIVTDPQAKGHLALGDQAEPTPSPSQALVRVEAISLNRGEVRRALASQERYVPGWDLAGEVMQPAADGSGPQAGRRVVGYLPSGAWAQRVAVPANALAEVPDPVPLSQAATLPVAGLTALFSIQKAGSLLGRRVLVTGASGGVGGFAVQLAYRSGAFVVGLTQHPEYAEMVREAGAGDVVVGDPEAARSSGPYHLICDGVGGDTLSTVATMLAPGGICVTYAALTQPEIPLNLRAVVQTPSAYLTGLMVLSELKNEPASLGLARLVALIQDGRLRPHIEVEAPWEQVAEVCQRLMERRFPGKAVLRVS
jgi:NADPH:quinone reductase-like Zn-dependent oxidoreductase